MAVDEELLEAFNKAIDGEEEGFNVIYQKTYSYVYARCRMIMKNEDDAQELLQETYLQAYKSLNKLENLNGIYAWMGSIAYNQGMKVFRKNKEVLLDEDGQGLFEVQETADVSSLPGHELELKETADIVKDIIDELPDAQRAVITAYYYDEMSVSKIAELMDTSTGTIKSRLNYARKHIQEAVESKEKQMGIKLHSISIPVLILALRGKADAMAMSSQVAQANYMAICSKSGIAAVPNIQAAEAGAVGAAAATTVESGTAATLLLAAKIIAGTVLVIGAIMGGVVVGKVIKDFDDNVETMITEEEDREQNNVAENSEEKKGEETSEEVTEEDIVKENDTESPAEKDDLTKAKIRNAYMGAVWQALHGKWADGSDIDTYDFVLNEDGEATGEFSFVDFEGAGQELLYIDLGDTNEIYNWGGTKAIYKYNKETDTVEALYQGKEHDIEFYENGVIKTNSNVPRMLGPFSFLSGGGIVKYDPVTTTLTNVGDWVCMAIADEDYFKEQLPIDKDGNRILYNCHEFQDLDEYVDDADFEAWQTSYFNGLKKMELSSEPLSRENIQKYSLEYFEQVDKMEQEETPGVYDIGIAYVQNGLQNVHPSNILDNMKENYPLDVTSSEYGDEDYVSYNGTSAFTFYNDDAGVIAYQNVQVDNIVMLGLYPGMDENEAYEKLERYEMRRSDESEVVAYVSGENADNIELDITIDNGKVSMIKIFFRPIIAG